MIKVPQSYKGKPLVHSYDYLATDGGLFGAVGRYQNGNEKKDVIPFFKHNGVNWAHGIDLAPRPLFGLDKLAKHQKHKAVLIVEGEKAAAALHGLDICAVTSLGGSDAASQTDWSPLKGYKLLYLLPDNDAPGEHYIRDVYKALSALEQPAEIKIVHLPGLNERGDIVDFLQNLAPDWDGYQTFPSTEKGSARSKLAIELKKAIPIPAEWNQRRNDSAGFKWGIPNQMDSKKPAVEALRTELMPPILEPWLSDVAHRMQTPPDFTTTSALVIISSIIGACCEIRPKRLDDWGIVPNLWGACIGRPSVVLKSPSMKEAMKLLEKLQEKYKALHAQEKGKADFENLTNKSMLDDIKAQLAKATKGMSKDQMDNDDQLQSLKAAFLKLSQNEASEPVRRLFKANETSIQSMTVLQNKNPRGLLVSRDELTGLLARWDREDCEADRAYFLEGWNGNSSYTDDKISRGLTDAKQVCISLLGGIQPDKLNKYLYQAMQGNNDGLMQRLQLAVWPDEPKCWQLIDTKPNQAARLKVYAVMESLAEIDFTRFGAEQNEHDDRPYFRFDDAGQIIFNQWLTELQTVRLKQEENPLMAEHLGKFRSLMPSLALIFHCIEIADGQAYGSITERSAKLAVEWCKYLESHARRIYAMAENPEHEAAVKLSKKIQDGCLPSPFTTKLVYDKGWHGLKDREEVEAACNILFDENWLMMTRKQRAVTGRPPLPEYHINPVCIAKRVH